MSIRTRELNIIRELVHIANEDGRDMQRRLGSAENRGACILMTAIGCDVLTRFNIRALPFSVHFGACNAAFRAWVDQGQIEPRPIDVSWLDTEANEGLSGDEEDGFAGHLLVHVPSHQLLMDLDLGQFTRASKEKIVLPQASLFKWPKGSTQCTYSFRGGAKVLIAARPEALPALRPGTLEVAAHLASEIEPQIRGRI